MTADGAANQIGRAVAGPGTKESQQNPLQALIYLAKGNEVGEQERHVQHSGQRKRPADDRSFQIGAQEGPDKRGQERAHDGPAT